MPASLVSMIALGLAATIALASLVVALIALRSARRLPNGRAGAGSATPADLGRARASARDLPGATHIPYSAHVSEHVVRTKSGDYVQAFRLAGASFESADDSDINAWDARLNVLWRNIASAQVALWTHVIRRREEAYPEGECPPGFARDLDRRYRERVGSETLMVNELYLAIVYRPQTGAVAGSAFKLLARASETNDAQALAEALEACAKLRTQLEVALERYEPQVLGIEPSPAGQGGGYRSTLLEYFARLLNGEPQPMPLARAPLDEVLLTSRPFFGAESMEYRMPTATRIGAFLGIKEYPTPTSPGLFNLLLRADFPFVLTQSFTFIPKATAQGLLAKQYNRMRNAQDLAVSQAEQLKEALDALASNEFVMGDHHFSLQVLADPFEGTKEAEDTSRLKALLDHIAQARTLLAETGMVVAREDLALEAAYWAQLPGNFAYRPRKAPITSLNFAAMAAFHNYPTGRREGNHWGDALTMLITSARSPYYFSLHASDPREPEGGSRKDIGHASFIGPSGTGKTVLVGFQVCMLRKFGATQVIFDKDRGLEILVRAEGGQYLALADGVPTGLNPLQLAPTPANVEFLKTWLRRLVRRTDHPGTDHPLSVREEADLDQALAGTLGLPPATRRLSRLIEYLDPTDPEGLYARLAPWTEKEQGDYAWVFDNREDTVVSRLQDTALIGFDVTDFLSNDRTRAPVTMVLFHLVKGLLDGRRLVVWMDEFSRLLDDRAFERFAKDGLKTWRKLDAVAAFATQSPSDVLASPIARTLIEQTPTKVFFPNPEASEADYIDGFALTEEEFRLVKDELTPGSRMFLVKQAHQSIVCELDLKGFAFELDVISGRAANVALMHRCIEAVGPDPAQWLPRFRAALAKRLGGSAEPASEPVPEPAPEPTLGAAPPALSVAA